ncbi:cytochrome c oxidase subunit II [Pullulanibacillus sp. KACC 23026]|uniref:cytochrome c oxidase subunit II n=1 Tax=Pullulanibacillus sp. KACC 23026 TaxID=3028315 RepID=UPI0023B16D93|nr:cytochrome c oxidase subunit II [Pullulanibacillus sp. KACC 23026]WEG12067.1 cytochrome c oxidase subunit II [Pullulanibacillus sp. KACC 23026]
MPKTFRRGILGVLFTALSLFLLSGCSSKYPVLDPAGPVAKEELHLIELSALLCLIVVLPVIILLFVIIAKYRDRPNRKAKYQPEWAESAKLELIWWSIPIIIIIILGTFTARSIFHLQQPVTSASDGTKAKAPITIEVTSMAWKWVFMYPGQGVATVNTLEIPTDRPVQFVLTTDGPMNTLWIPSLGGQEMTMPGMAMRLWLQADKAGTYIGKGGNFSGKGFADMSFKVHAVSQNDFDKWVSNVKNSSPKMTTSTYNKLTKHNVVGVSTYSSYPKSIYTKTIEEYGGKDMKDWMINGTDPSSMPSMSGNSGM